MVVNAERDQIKMFEIAGQSMNTSNSKKSISNSMCYLNQLYYILTFFFSRTTFMKHLCFEEQENFNMPQSPIELHQKFNHMSQSHQKKTNHHTSCSEQSFPHSQPKSSNSNEQSKLGSFSNSTTVKEKRNLIRTSLKSNLVMIRKRSFNTTSQIKEIQSGDQLKRRRLSCNYKNFDSLNLLKQETESCPFFDKYQILEAVGEGAHATVYKCEDIFTKNIYAAKITKIKDEELIQSMKEQYRVLKNLNHNNLLQGKYFYVNQKKLVSYLICEYIDYPTLRHFMDQHKKEKINSATLSQIFYQILKGIQYMHDKKVCHRDLKPQNILYDPFKNKIKIIDFDLAKMTRYSHEKLQMWTNTGTLSYRAPQSFHGNYNEMIDMWSFGVMAYEMITGELPFKNIYSMDTIKQICEGTIDWKQLLASQKAKPFQIKFLQKILVKDPNCRLKAKQALSCPFILKFHEMEHSNESKQQKSNRSSSNIRIAEIISEAESENQNEDDDKSQNKSSSKRNLQRRSRYYDQETKYSLANDLNKDIGIRVLKQ